MLTILVALVLVLIIIKYLIFLDVILSWLTMFGIKFRPYLLVSVIEPLYKFVKSKISTSLGPIDFTPIIIFIFIEVLIGFIYGINVLVKIRIENISSLLNYL